MVNLLPAPDSSHSASEPEVTSPQSMAAIMKYLVLKLCATPDHTPIPALNAAPVPVLTAMQRLVELITQFRSPNSGWPADQPQTPETLLPYVQDEVQDVLDALQSHPPVPTSDLSSPHTLLEHPFLWLKTLAPWLLWSVARSSHDSMQLLEGRSATLQTRTTEQAGILRLVAILDIQSPVQSYRLDLATQAAPAPLLADDERVQLNPSTLTASPLAVTDLMQRLKEQIQFTTPAIVPFFHGLPAELLMPQQRWQSGLLRLHLGLEFIPVPHLSLAPSMLPAIEFTDRDWLEQYQTQLLQQYGTTLLRHLSSLNPVQDPANLPDALRLIADADAVSQHCQRCLTLASRQFLQPETNLGEMAPRLWWSLMHSSYEVMQFISGIPASLLVPQSSYQQGMLRFSIHLKIQTFEADWNFDLASGHLTRVEPISLNSDSIVQSDEVQWCQQPTLLAHLETKIWQHIYQAMPELQLLRQGTEADWIETNHSRRSAMIQLWGGFEFIPRSR